MRINTESTKQDQCGNQHFCTGTAHSLILANDLSINTLPVLGMDPMDWTIFAQELMQFWRNADSPRKGGRHMCFLWTQTWILSYSTWSRTQPISNGQTQAQRIGSTTFITSTRQHHSYKSIELQAMKYTKNGRCRWKHRNTHTWGTQAHEWIHQVLGSPPTEPIRKKTNSLPFLSPFLVQGDGGASACPPECVLFLSLTMQTMICKTLLGGKEFWARIPVASTFENFLLFLNKENLKYSQLRRVIHSRSFVFTEKSVSFESKSFLPLAWEPNTPYRILEEKHSAKYSQSKWFPYMQNVGERERGKGDKLKYFLWKSWGSMAIGFARTNSILVHFSRFTTKRCFAWKYSSTRQKLSHLALWVDVGVINQRWISETRFRPVTKH